MREKLTNNKAIKTTEEHTFTPTYSYLDSIDLCSLGLKYEKITDPYGTIGR